jgi:oligosaccharide reducing-end xylanase
MWAEENNEFWREAAEAARDLLRKSCHEKTGLFPDYSRFDGIPHNPNWPNMSYDTRQYKFDAIRCAMNVGMDYNWFRSDSANQTQMMTRLMHFFKTDNYRHAYFDWDGGNPEGNFNEGMAGANGAGCLAINDNELAKSVLQKLWDTNPPSGQWRYFNGMVYFLGMLNASGNFRVYKPMPNKSKTD